MNKCFLMGNLGDDAELRVTAGGRSILQFRLATTEKWTNSGGEKQEKTSWHRCQLWGDRAQKLAQYLTKGKKVLVEGSIEYGSYEKESVKHYTTDIKVMNIEFVGDSRGASSGAEAPTRRQASAPATDNADDGFAPSYGGDEEIPF